MSWKAWLAVAAAVAAGCAGGRGAGDSAAESGLASTLQVRVIGDTVRLDLYVTNSGDSAVELEYPTAQRFDFEVRTAEGTRLWRWSEGRAFAQVEGRERLAGGQTLHHRADWVAAEGRSGLLVAEGRLATSEPRVERQSTFELP